VLHPLPSRRVYYQNRFVTWSNNSSRDSITSKKGRRACSRLASDMYIVPFPAWPLRHFSVARCGRVDRSGLGKDERREDEPLGDHATLEGWHPAHVPCRFENTWAPSVGSAAPLQRNRRTAAGNATSASQPRYLDNAQEPTSAHPTNDAAPSRACNLAT
jgi:hypothetical protein